MARKSRARAAGEAQHTNGTLFWNIALYIRLSREDGRSRDESESMTNQRKIGLEYIEETFSGEPHRLVGVYADDGRSGTSEDIRPDFQRLCRDIEAGKINCVVCKSLSRAFRNYADQGKFLEQFLPACGCRFIAIGNPFVDTFADPDCTRNMEIPINGLMNDRYAARTSEDVRRTFRMKRKRGEFIGAFAPFGYRKNPDNKNALLPDEEAAQIVREIYSLYLNGMSKSAIVRRLNDSGTPCPALYKRQRQGTNYRNPNVDPAANPLWSYRTVHDILQNRVYCGDMVQGRYRIRSYKVHVQERVPKDDWFLVENTHEPIIDRKTFAQVQRLLQRDTRTSPQRERLYPFSGFLRCADCGRAMVRSQSGKTVYYRCSTYKSRSQKACTGHTLRHDRLQAAVLCAIRKQVLLSVDPAKALAKIDRLSPAKDPEKRLSEAIRRREGELEKTQRYRRSLYQDWKDGLIAREDFLHLKGDYEKEVSSLREEIRKLQEERDGIAGEGQGEPAEDPELAAFREEGNFSTLSRGLMIELIDCIQVQEGGRIRIVFRFSEGSGG